MRVVGRDYGGVLNAGCKALLEEAVYAVQYFLLRMRFVHEAAEFGAVHDAMRKPASELFHFANAIGEIGSGNLLVVARK